jgi:hypothetical protein
MGEPCIDESPEGHQPDGPVSREPHRHGGESRTCGLPGPEIGVDLAGAEVSTDMLRSRKTPPGAGGVAAHNRHDPGEATEDGLGMADSPHPGPRTFLARFNGVSTRGLGMCLRWSGWPGLARRPGPRRRTGGTRCAGGRSSPSPTNSGTTGRGGGRWWTSSPSTRLRSYQGWFNSGL